MGYCLYCRSTLQQLAAKGDSYSTCGYCGVTFCSSCPSASCPLVASAVVIHLQLGRVELVNKDRALLIYVQKECLPAGLATKGSLHITLAYDASSLHPGICDRVCLWRDTLVDADRVAWLLRWGHGVCSALIDGPFLLHVERLWQEESLWNDRPLHIELHDRTAPSRGLWNEWTV